MTYLIKVCDIARNEIYSFSTKINSILEFDVILAEKDHGLSNFRCDT